MKFRSIFTNSIIFLASTMVATTALDRAMQYSIEQGWYTPHLAHAPQAHERRQNLEFDIDFATNDQGFRNPPIATHKDARQRRILVVGDSFVEGFGVEEEETFTARLNGKLSTTQSVELINAGISGQGPKKYEEIVRAYTRKLDIDGVLICLYANDLWDMDTLENRHPLLRLAVDTWPTLTSLVKNARRSSLFQKGDDHRKTGNFMKQVYRQAKIQNIPDEDVRAWENQLQPNWTDAANKGHISAPILSFGLLHPDFWSDSIDVESADAKRKWQLMASSLTDMEEYLADIDVELGVVYIPSVFQYDPDSHDDDNPWASLGSKLSDTWLSQENGIVTLLKAHYQDSRVPFLDMTPGLREAVNVKGSVLNFDIDEHLTALGHEVVSAQLKDWLAERSVFSFVD